MVHSHLTRARRRIPDESITSQHRFSHQIHKPNSTPSTIRVTFQTSVTSIHLSALISSFPSLLIAKTDSDTPVLFLHFCLHFVFYKYFHAYTLFDAYGNEVFAMSCVCFSYGGGLSLNLPDKAKRTSGG
jgi:hypothetical protein